MARRRLGVVLLVPEPASTEIQGLRRAVGDPALDAIPAHLTLVPPVNVREAELPLALARLRAAAGAAEGTIEVTLGPPATFPTPSPVLYLAVGGDLEALTLVRDSVFAAPLHRRLDHPFHPHVTLATELPAERLAAAVAVMPSYRTTAAFDRVHLLEERRLGDGRRVWRAVADAPFARPAVIGTGGLPLEVTVTALADPEVAAVLGAGDHDSIGPTDIVVTARREGRVVGAAAFAVEGHQVRLTGIAVVPAERGTGVGGHLLERAARAAADVGGTALVARTTAAAHDAWLGVHGWRAPPGTDTRARPWRPRGRCRAADPPSEHHSPLAGGIPSLRPRCGRWIPAPPPIRRGRVTPASSPPVLPPTGGFGAGGRAAYPPQMPAPWTRALVTGASSGIGRAIASRLAADGTDLVLVARTVAALEEVAADARRHGVEADVVVADLADGDDLATVEARLVGHPPVDLLVNNAGFGTYGRFHTLDIEEEQREIAVNVVAPVRLTRAAIGGMLDRGTGSIMNISSMASLQPTPGNATYGATKAFLTAFSESLHEELRGTGVKVTAVLPGFTHTGFQARAGLGTTGGLPSFVWQEAEECAAEAVAATRAGRAIVVPGTLNKVTAAGSAALPRAAKRRLVGVLSTRFKD